MQDTSPITPNTNIKSTSDTDRFSIPVSSSPASATTTPTVTDFTAPSSSSSPILVLLTPYLVQQRQIVQVRYQVWIRTR